MILQQIKDLDIREVQYLCKSKKSDLDNKIDLFKKKLRKDYRKKVIKHMWNKKCKEIQSKEEKEIASRALDDVLLADVLKSEDLKRFISNERKKIAEDLINKISNTKSTDSSAFYLKAATIGYEIFKDMGVIELCFKADDIMPHSIYTYNVITNFLEDFSEYVSEKFVKFHNPKDTFSIKSYVEEYSPNWDFNILDKLKKRFLFLPRPLLSSSNRKGKELELSDLFKKDSNLLSELEIHRRMATASRLITDLRFICQSFYHEIAKEVFNSKDFKKNRFTMSKNEVYEIDDPFLNKTLIIKKSKESNNLELEAKIIEAYKESDLYSRNTHMLLYLIAEKQIPNEEKEKFLKWFKEQSISLPEIIDLEIHENEQYLFLKRKKGMNCLEYLKISKKIQNIIMNYNDYRESLKKSLKVLYEYPNDFGFLKRVLKKADLSIEDYKTELLKAIKTDTMVIFQDCLGELAKLNARIPVDVIKKELIRGDYKKDVLSVLSSFEKNLNEKFSEQFKDEFLKNYDVIDSVLSSSQKYLYKDAYLKNWVIDDSKLLNKNSDPNLNPKIVPIDFERCAIAPVQIDLAFMLDFGNFIDDKQKDELLDYYIGNMNCFINRIKQFDNKSNIPPLVSDKESFKRIFDYACVHRNLLTFRSYNRFIEEGYDSKEAKDYKKISLENSIKAIKKIINYEKNNVNELKSVCNDLEDVYHKIYN